MQTIKRSKMALAFMLISAFAGISVALPSVFSARDSVSAVENQALASAERSMNLLSLFGQTKLYPVSRGEWGGQSLSFVVEKNSVKLEFDCAEGEIPRQLKADKRGNFKVEGTFTRHSPGPVRRDAIPQPVPALYEGVVKGKVIKLKASLLKTNESLGDFTIELGRRPAITRCY